jgi:hypothetical protein
VGPGPVWKGAENLAPTGEKLVVLKIILRKVECFHVSRNVIFPYSYEKANARV